MIAQLAWLEKRFSRRRPPLLFDRSPAARAIRCFLEAPLPGYLTGYEDPCYDRGREYMDAAAAAGDKKALQLAVFVDSGLSGRVKPRWDRLEGSIRALYEKTKDPQLLGILADFDGYLLQCRVDWEDTFFAASVQEMADRGDLSAAPSHDSAYYEELYGNEE